MTEHHCPPDDVVAAYLDGTLDAVARDELEAHVARCDRCIALIGAAIRSESTVADSRDDLLIARAARFARRRSTTPLPVLATAAAVLLGVGLVFSLGVPTASVDDAPTVRGERLLDRGAAVPTITAPLDRASIELGELEVDWSAVPGARYYEIRVVDDDGDLVVVQRVDGTEWKPAHDLALSPGSDFYVRVDAYTEDGRPHSSEHVLFHLVETN
jgi:hypothetical protein